MGMALDEPKENEQPVKVNEIDVLLAEHDRPYAEGLVVDYVKQPYGEGFIIDGGGSC